jgi:autotransporter family porin
MLTPCHTVLRSAHIAQTSGGQPASLYRLGSSDRRLQRLRQSLLASVLIALCHGNAMAAQVAVTLSAYNPQVNDNLVGAQIVNAGDVMTLSGPQLFQAGDSGARSTTLSTLQTNGRIVSGAQWIGALRLNPGTQNYGVTIPDPITGGTRVTSTYASANLVQVAPVMGATTVSDDVNVNGAMYINARVATVSPGGSLNVNIGKVGALSTASTNGWTMSAKNTVLFEADDTAANASNINWASNNRITFTGDVAPTATQTLGVTYVSTYGGTFNVTTSDGVTSSHTVNNDSDLRTYNNWLISQLQSGNLDPSLYNTDFNLAYTSTTQTIGYTASATAPDEVTLPIGNRVVIYANGTGATGTVNAGSTLEVVNSNTGAMRADGGGVIINNGTLATTHTAGDGVAMALNGSAGQNNGVINGNFFLAANGTTTNGAYGSNVVNLASASTFSNTGIINLATGSTNGAGASAGINILSGSTATSSGIINVGVTGSKANGSMTGVLLGDGTGSFTNTSSGTIYIGRGPQTSASVNPADVAVNQGTLSAGITVNGNATALNQGTITIGSLTQNAAGIAITGGSNANVVNSGTINVNGAAAF